MMDWKRQEVGRHLKDFIVFTNIFVALGVTALSIETLLLFGFFDAKYPALLFLLTLFIYTFHRVYRLNYRSPKEQLEGRHRWVRKNPKLALGILIVSAVGIVCGLLAWSNLNTILCLIPIACISLAYSIPCIKTSKGMMRLRDVKGLKIIVISLVLGLTTVMLPLVFYNKLEASQPSELILVFVRRLFFIFAITLPFDIRDIEYDRENNVKTIPTLLGIKWSIRLSICALVLFIFLAGLQAFAFHTLSFSSMLALSTSALVALYLVIQVDKGKEELFYSLAVEGTMLLQLILVLVSYSY